jgi:hypothetical protein
MVDFYLKFKGTGSPDGLRYFCYVWIDVGINKRLWQFLNFLSVSSGLPLK